MDSEAKVTDKQTITIIRGKRKNDKSKRSEAERNASDVSSES